MSTEPVVAETIEPTEVVPEPVVATVAAPAPAGVVLAVEQREPLVVGRPVEWLGLRGRVRQSWWIFRSVSEWLFGAFALTVGLAFLAAIPIAQFLALGYLLEASGRIGRTGRLRNGFVGVRKAARLGSIVLGTWLMLFPLRLVSDLWESAELIEPGGLIARVWKVGLIALTIVMFLHILGACARGGKLRYFFWPFTTPLWLARRIARGGYYTEARDAVWNFVISLRLPYYFWLGLRGFAGTFVWLAVPVALIAAGRKVPPLGFLGAALLIYVVCYVPFLQVRFAAENRFRALFELRAIRDHFRRAPWAFAVALLLTLLFALPLYLLKIEMIPRETAWMTSLVFLVFIFPARLLAGWAYGLAARRAWPRHWFFRWTGRLLLIPTAAFYVLIVFFTQYTGWNGIWSLYEQHAFLLPVPFFGM
jgi:hypothetical protein